MGTRQLGQHMVINLMPNILYMLDWKHGLILMSVKSPIFIFFSKLSCWNEILSTVVQRVEKQQDARTAAKAERVTSKARACKSSALHKHYFLVLL